MKKILAQIGLDDGEGNISLMRVIVLLAALSVLLPHLILACKAETLAWTPDDWKILSIAIGGKALQSFAENSTADLSK